MLFSLIKANQPKKSFQLNTPFVIKSSFLDLDSRKCLNYNDFRVDYSPLIGSSSDSQLLVRTWYLVLVLRTIRAPFIGSKTSVFSYRRTKLFSSYQDAYELSLNKQFYETFVEHRELFYSLGISTPSIDKLYLIFCLYALKTNFSETKTVILKNSVCYSSNTKFVSFLLRKKWKFRIKEFV